MKKLKIFFALILIFSIIPNAKAITYLTNCSTLSGSSTYYMLSNDINSTVTNCFSMTGTDSILDCNNHYISGRFKSGYFDYGVDFGSYGSPTYVHNTVKNCKFYNLYGGIWNERANNNTFLDNIFDENVSYGIHVYKSESALISGNKFYDTNVGVRFQENNYYHNTINNYFYGDYNFPSMFILYGYPNNNFYNNFSYNFFNNSYFWSYNINEYDIFIENVFQNTTFNGTSNSHMEFRRCNFTDGGSLLLDGNALYNTIDDVRIISSRSVGLSLGKSSNVVIYSVISNNNGNGVQLGTYDNSSFNFIYNNTITNNNGIGIYNYRSNNSQILNNIIKGNQYGIEIESSQQGILTNNFISDNQIGIYWLSGNNWNISNNLFNSTSQNVYLGGSFSNNWNTTMQNGTRIYYGIPQFNSYIGGNYYAYPNTTGYSQTCAYDNNYFCINPYVLSVNNVDYLAYGGNVTHITCSDIGYSCILSGCECYSYLPTYWCGYLTSSDWYNANCYSTNYRNLTINSTNIDCGVFSPSIDIHSYALNTNVTVVVYPICNFTVWELKNSSYILLINNTIFTVNMTTNYNAIAYFNYYPNYQNSSVGGGVSFSGNYQILNIFTSGYMVLGLFNLGISGLTIYFTKSFELGIAVFLLIFMAFLFNGFYPSILWLPLVFAVAYIITMIVLKIGSGE